MINGLVKSNLLTIVFLIIYILTGGHYICVEMRRTMNCKTISGPIRSEIFLKVKKDLQASAIVIYNLY